jgi:metallophosphoesterase superfamily enzyme
MSTTLVIPDLHEPSSRKGALPFCRDLRRKYKPDKIVFIGDVVDWHSISFHAHHPEMPGPKDEFELAYARVNKWYRAFPEATVILGNHDRRVIRLAESVNIPARFIRDYKEIWDTPKWNWVDDLILDEVYFIHGDGCGGGLCPAYNMVRKMGMSCVMGHYHSAAGFKYLTNPLRRMFGLDVGSLIDDKTMAFAYGRKQVIRSTLGAAVIRDGHPQFIAMPCGAGEKYHDSRF